MSVDFDDQNCKALQRQKKFGLTDKEGGGPASISHDENGKWNATVLNKNAIAVAFTAIDNCIEFYRSNGEMARRCDGMLTDSDTVIFVELKNAGGRWIPDGTKQLDNTIDIFKENKNLIDYKA